MLEEWFIKSFLPSITEDVAKCTGVVTKEQVISHAKYLDLIYAQSSMLYENILDAPRALNTSPTTTSKESHVVDGIIGSVSSHTMINQILMWLIILRSILFNLMKENINNK